MPSLSENPGENSTSPDQPAVKHINVSPEEARLIADHLEAMGGAAAEVARLRADADKAEAWRRSQEKGG